MAIRHRFLTLAVVTYTVGAAVVIAAPWHDRRVPLGSTTHDVVAVAATNGASAAKRPTTAVATLQPLPTTLPLVTVRPDDRHGARLEREQTKSPAPLLDAARAASGSLLSNAALRMPYYSFGRTVRRDSRG